MSKEVQNTNLFQQVAVLLKNAQQQVLRTVNSTMVFTYFEIGRMIVEEEQNGKERADYGKQVLKGLSEQLTKEFGKGFSLSNLEQIRKFFLIYSKSETLLRISQIQNSQSVIVESESTIPQSLIVEFKKFDYHTLISFFKLTWTHYLFLMRIEDENERSFYEIETEKNNWSVRELKRQYDTALYARLALSRDKEGILKLAKEGQIIEKPKDIIKDPYILEFLGLPEMHQYSESDLEEQIIDKLEHFLLELGHGFAFVARQQRISFDEKHFRVDLVFYNRVLRSFVLIDLKIGDLKHQDLGQMQMYVNYYDREMRLEGENKTIGIVLCQNKNDLLVEYTLPEDNEQIFASKYKTILPSKEDFKRVIEG